MMRENLGYRFQSIWNQACLGSDPETACQARTLLALVVPHLTWRSPDLWLAMILPAQDVTVSHLQKNQNTWPAGQRRWLTENQPFETGEASCRVVCKQDHWGEVLVGTTRQSDMWSQLFHNVVPTPWPALNFTGPLFPGRQMGVNYA